MYIKKKRYAYMFRIILDTDPGIDDALALFLALASPEVQLEAITTVGGNVTKVDRTIVFYDSWFMSDQSLFTGGTGTIAPASLETPLHEFGHVVGAQAGIKDAFEKTFTDPPQRWRQEWQENV